MLLLLLMLLLFARAMLRYAVRPYARQTTHRAAARTQGIDVITGKFPWSANGRARGMGATDGFIKLVAAASTGQLLGAHIVGPYASELIGELTHARLIQSTLEELDLTVHPHPTLSDSISEAALMAHGLAVHL